MNWKFWQKNAAPATGTGLKKEAKPRDLPQIIGQHLVVDKGMDPDWVWALKVVTREKEKGILDFRLFDPGASPVKITGFSTLEDLPDQVLFEGWYEKNGTRKEIRDLRKDALNGNAA